MIRHAWRASGLTHHTTPLPAGGTWEGSCLSGSGSQRRFFLGEAGDEGAEDGACGVTDAVGGAGDDADNRVDEATDNDNSHGMK